MQTEAEAEHPDRLLKTVKLDLVYTKIIIMITYKLCSPFIESSDVEAMVETDVGSVGTAKMKQSLASRCPLLQCLRRCFEPCSGLVLR